MKVYVVLEERYKDGHSWNVIRGIFLNEQDANNYVITNNIYADVIEWETQ